MKPVDLKLPVYRTEGCCSVYRTEEFLESTLSEGEGKKKVGNTVASRGVATLASRDCEFSIWAWRWGILAKEHEWMY